MNFSVTASLSAYGGCWCGAVVVVVGIFLFLSLSSSSSCTPLVALLATAAFSALLRFIQSVAFPRRVVCAHRQDKNSFQFKLETNHKWELYFCWAKKKKLGNNWISHFIAWTRVRARVRRTWPNHGRDRSTDHCSNQHLPVVVRLLSTRLWTNQS